ncbi:MAG: hypothetical protein EBU84_15130 [Actinobacteria bacterium]|nr:hypothetical protein [Actinomycetota bacterium]
MVVEEHFIMFKMLLLEDLVVVGVGKMELNQEQELSELRELLDKEILVEMVLQEDLQTMEVVAAVEPEQLDQMELLLPEVQVVLVFKFLQHLEIHYHNQDQEQHQYLGVD